MFLRRLESRIGAGLTVLAIFLQACGAQNSIPTAVIASSIKLQCPSEVSPAVLEGLRRSAFLAATSGGRQAIVDAMTGNLLRSDIAGISSNRIGDLIQVYDVEGNVVTWVVDSQGIPIDCEESTS